MTMKNMAVIGAGTMGNGIAHVFAQNGWKVTLIDVNNAQLDRAVNIIKKNLERMQSKGTLTPEQVTATLENISTHTDLKEGVQQAELVVEAATENKEIKLSLFKALDAAAPTDCILASNTSSIPIQTIAAATKRPEKVIGMHFMNPVPVMKLVEIITGPQTDKAVADQIVSYSKALQKVPCVVNDFPGFIANRILMPMINEAICSLQEGVAGVEEIDTIMKLGMAHPMGPLQLADLIGLDVCLSIMQVLHEGFKTDKYAPASLLEQLVKEGKLGIKTGEGFYQYTPGSKELVVSNRFRQ
jgi:3-hydroxybutyryl-CoA dehydrogenase